MKKTMDIQEMAAEGQSADTHDRKPTSPTQDTVPASFCSLPWTHVFVSPQGEIKPCCRYKRGSDFPEYSSPTTAVISPYWQQLRATMREGKTIPGCTKCDQEDFLQTRSLRQKINSDALFALDPASKTPSVRSLEIALSNACNLTCVMCDSRFSTAWSKAEKQLYGKTIFPEKKYRFNPKDLEDFPDLRLLKMTGGEPFMEHALHHSTLEYIVKNLPVDEFILDYSTNLTVLPKPEIIELWSQFKRVEITLSLDSIFDDELRYIRYPSNGATVRTHVRFYLQLMHQLPHLHIVNRPTVHSLNITSMLYTLQWWHTEKVKFGVTGRIKESVSFLAYPEFLHPSSLLPQESEHVRNLLLDFENPESYAVELSAHRNTLLHYLNEKTFNPIQAKKFKAFLKSIDSLRKTDYQQQFSYLSAHS